MKKIPNDQAADSPAMPDRRKFLVAGASVAAAASLLPKFSFAAQGNSERSSAPLTSGTRKLGKLEVYSIGLGVQLLTKTSGERISQLSDKNNQRLNCAGCF